MQHHHHHGQPQGCFKGPGNQFGGNQYPQGQFQQNQGGMMNDKDQQLRNAIDQIFYKYDKDNSGSMNEKEFGACIGELCKMLNKPQPKDYNEFIQIAKTIDTNYDGKISKVELFNVFKKMGY